MRSCLKVTPPVTPELSVRSTPCVSGRTSPSSSPERPCLRKCVSFCGQDELEQVFIADEWDRSPAPVTPKLSYQDILELKQLQLSLPRAPPPPTYRQPFTTSCPTTYDSPHPTFPMSPLASRASHTPSRWKNRQQDPADVDPEILPYLDAVPIRLLPLLDTTTQSQSTSSLTEEPCTMPRPEPPPTSIPPMSAVSVPVPNIGSLPAANYASITDTHTRNSSNSSGSGSITSPASAPRVEVSSPKDAVHNSPSSSPTLTPTLQRTRNFAFLPLLPVEEPLVLPTPIMEPPPPPPGPRRKINMMFLPLCEAKDTTETTPESQPQPHAHAAFMDRPSTPTHSTFGEVHTPLETVVESPGEEVEEPSILPPTSLAHPSRQSRIPLVLSVPGPTATPSLSSASDTEPETDTDTCTDTDADSDFAPSTGASSVSSPQCDVDASEYFFAKTNVDDGSSAGDDDASTEEMGQLQVRGHSPSIDVALPHPGMTPPLGVLYPSDPNDFGLPFALGPGHAHAYTHVPALKSVKLQALPSPVLAPPSPFSLYPPSPTAGAGADAGGSFGLPGVALSMTTTTTTTVTASTSTSTATTTATTTKREFVTPRKAFPQPGLNRTGSCLGLGVQMGRGGEAERTDDLDTDDAETDSEGSMRRQMLAASLSRRRG